MLLLHDCGIIFGFYITNPFSKIYYCNTFIRLYFEGEHFLDIMRALVTIMMCIEPF